MKNNHNTIGPAIRSKIIDLSWSGIKKVVHKSAAATAQVAVDRTLGFGLSGLSAEINSAVIYDVIKSMTDTTRYGK